MDQSRGHIQNAWHRTTEGRQYYASIVRQGKRKVYGLLERPVFSNQLNVETVSYKLFVSGKAGVGKSSTIAKLTGHTVPMSHVETPGIVTSVAYWPAKLVETNQVVVFKLHSLYSYTGIVTSVAYWPGKLVETNQVVLFKLHFWDAGENAIKKYDHILPACQDSVSAILFLFSFTDRPSFEDLRNQMTRLAQSAPDTGGATPIKIVIGTKYDQYSHSEITSRELQDFQEHWQVPILKVKNICKPQENDLLYSVDNFAEINDVAPLLNGLVESLWSEGRLGSERRGTEDAGGAPTGRPPGGHRTPAPIEGEDELDATYV